eukprot:TRINITY_DN11258_c0_g1_i9.p1 TRINITY_DN11258_c0_g1~~TRINITY_DN11258_c0_g1_i9.p1  ORF type:complete len:169 (-),score=29.20 TRINITY_DN11258_c0_g1_i9:147-653(-)
MGACQNGGDKEKARSASRRAERFSVHELVRQGEAEELTRRIERNSSLIDAEAVMTKETPLVLAAKYARPDCVKLLLNSGCILRVERGPNAWQWANKNVVPAGHSTAAAVPQAEAKECLALLTEAFESDGLPMIPFGQRAPRLTTEVPSYEAGADGEAAMPRYCTLTFE